MANRRSESGLQVVCENALRNKSRLPDRHRRERVLERVRVFGLRLQAFLAVAEPIAIEMFGKSFADLTQSEQAEVVRRIARDKNEGAE
jgi:hypothetical protein